MKPKLGNAMKRILMAAAIMFAPWFSGGSAYAAAFADFENALRDAYGDYRSAFL